MPKMMSLTKLLNFEDWALIFEKRRCTSAHKSSHSLVLCTLVIVAYMDEIHSQVVLDRITGDACSHM